MPELHINSLGGLGDGIGQLGGKPVFVEKAAAGDVLRIRLIQETREFSRGEIEEIIKAGDSRISPPCPHYASCGGCSLQHLSTSAYQAHKHKVALDALAHAGFADTPLDMIFLPAASRRRVELKWDGKRFAYYASRTRRLVPIDSCLILEPQLAALLAPLAKTLKQWQHGASIKTIRLTAADNGIEMALTTSHPHPTPLPYREREASLRAGEGQWMMAAAETLNISRLSKDGEILFERTPITMRLGNHDIPLPPDAFLQASRRGQDLLVQAVLAGCVGARSVVDLFCGIGTYSFPLSQKALVHGAELDKTMAHNLKQQAKKLGIASLSAEARDLFAAPLRAGELARFDAAVINPPRPGAKAQVEEIAKSTLSRVVMVSCNPASFARDAKILKQVGFSLISAQAIDQFVYSPHLEIVAVFAR